MTTDPLAALIDRWMNFAGEAEGDRNYDEAQHWKTCASELKAILAQLRAAEPVEVQACRPEDREMLKTPSGKALIRAVKKKIESENTGAAPINFWEWLDRAYRNGSHGDEPKFTKWNMEVAYRAGQDSIPSPLSSAQGGEEG